MKWGIVVLPSVPFENNHKLAHGVLDFLQDSPIRGRLSLRPFNRYSTAFTNWWLVPSPADWPAYHHSKLCFFMMPAQSPDGRSVLTGYYVEKGLHPSLRGLPDVKAPHIMGDDWYWHAFPSVTNDPEFFDAARLTLSLTSLPLLLVLDAYAFNKAPEPDEPSGNPSDTLVFRIADPKLQLMLDREPSADLSPFARHRSIYDLVADLHDSTDMRFFWLDLRIGIELAFKAPSQPIWHAREVWGMTLAPWLPWIK
jgi:hypothetical protein